MTPEQVIEKLDATFTEKMNNVPTNEDVESLRAELEALKGLEAKSQDIEKSIAKFEGRIEAMSEKAVEPKTETLSIGQAIGKAYADNLDQIKDAVEKGGKIALSVKDTDITNDYTGDYALTDFDSEGEKLAARLNYLLCRHRIMVNSRLRRKFMKFGKSRIEDFKEGDVHGKVSANIDKIRDKELYKGERGSRKA